MNIFTDGAYSSSRDTGGWAFYIPDLGIRVIGSEKATTNNRMELTAVLKALEFISDSGIEEEINIYSDSMYVVGGLTLNWSKNKNEDLWKDIQFVSELLLNRVHYYHIKGHSNNEENCVVDSLAVLGTNLVQHE